jgi:hypothetical protein
MKPAAAVGVFLALWPPASLIARPKTDIVTMRNGDRYTCEIVSLDQGQFQVKTVNTTGAVLLDWSKVDRIESNQFFVVELSDGSSFAGTIQKVPDKDTVADFWITAEGTTIKVSAPAVVVIARSGKRLQGRLSGNVSAGVNYAKGNSTRQYNVNATMTVRGRTQELIPSISSSFSGQSGATSTERNDFNLQYWKALSRNWVAGIYDDFLKSTEQQLDLRATVGGFGGRRLFRTNRTMFILVGGAVFTSEHYNASVGQPDQKSTEGLIGARFSMFRFDSTNITAQSFVFPSITDPGRVRIDTNVSGKVDLTHNFNLTLSFYNNFDSRPPPDVPRTDVGINLGLGWSF